MAVTNATDECDPLASAGTHVESGSFRYASIDCVEVQSVAVGCTSGAWRVPAGWELAPAGAASEAAAMGFPWGTHVAVLADGSGWWTSLGTTLVGPSGQYAGSHLTSDGQGGAGVDTCSLRVLVRQPTP